MEYREFRAGETLKPAPDVAVRTTALNHPDGATGYRVDYAGRSLCYLTDTEHVPGAPDRNILELIAGADLVIYDSMYTDAEYETYTGWGHSTWQGVRLCREAGASACACSTTIPSTTTTCSMASRWRWAADARVGRSQGWSRS